jgi:predicted lipoprotein with Yx(FWY)xxD motif
MNDVTTRTPLRRPATRARLAAGASMVITLTAAAAVTGPAALAQPSVLHSKTAVVVHEANRAHFGKIVVTARAGRALYYLPSGSCTGSCLSVWPRLLMPHGKTKPKGANCLSTKKVGSKLQVTYRGKRLYTFSGDSGHSVNGNGVSGFKVAKVRASC